MLSASGAFAHKYNTHFSTSACRYESWICFCTDKILVIHLSEGRGFCRQGYFVMLSGMDVFAALTQSLMNTDGQQILFKRCLSFRHLLEKFEILLYPGIGLHPDSDIRMQKAHNSIMPAFIQITLTEINPWL